MPSHAWALGALLLVLTACIAEDVPSADVWNRTGSEIGVLYRDVSGEVHMEETVAVGARQSIIGPFQSNAHLTDCPPGRWEVRLDGEILAVREGWCVGQTWEITAP